MVEEALARRRLEGVRVAGQADKEGQAERDVVCPVRKGNLLVHGHGDEVGEAEESEDDGSKSGGGIGLEELSGFRLQEMH